jgi:phage recombination protein Bet
MTHPPTDDEVKMFLAICQQSGLNPFIQEVYGIKYSAKDKMQIITSKDAFVKRAHKHPQFKGMAAGLIVLREGKVEEVVGSFMLPDDILMGGWARVHLKDMDVPFEDKVSLDEYNKGRGTWNTLQKTMIRKVALVHALREAFPDYFSKVFDEAEMDQAHPNRDLLKNIDDTQVLGSATVDETQEHGLNTASANPVPAQQQIDEKQEDDFLREINQPETQQETQPEPHPTEVYALAHPMADRYTDYGRSILSQYAIPEPRACPKHGTSFFLRVAEPGSGKDHLFWTCTERDDTTEKGYCIIKAPQPIQIAQ